jgi:hypothetical protein
MKRDLGFVGAASSRDELFETEKKSFAACRSGSPQAGQKPNNDGERLASAEIAIRVELLVKYPQQLKIIERLTKDIPGINFLLEGTEDAPSLPASHLDAIRTHVIQ